MNLSTAPHFCGRYLDPATLFIAQCAAGMCQPRPQCLFCAIERTDKCCQTESTQNADKSYCSNPFSAWHAKGVHGLHGWLQDTDRVCVVIETCYHTVLVSVAWAWIFHSTRSTQWRRQYFNVYLKSGKSNTLVQGYTWKYSVFTNSRYWENACDIRKSGVSGVRYKTFVIQT